MNWQAVTREPDELGESPFWHPGEGRLYWVDIPARKILRTDADCAVVDCCAPSARAASTAS